MCMFGFALLTGAYSAHGATLWDYVITAEFEHGRIGIYESPVIFGTVSDHAMKPVANVTVTIRLADTTATTITNATGDFRHEFAGLQMAGMFTANIRAESGDLVGLSKATLRVGDEAGTFGDMYYKSVQVPDGDNPYAALQLKHYQKYLEEQQKRLQAQLEIEAKRQALDEKKAIANMKLLEAIEYKRPGHGVYSGYQYEQYVAGLNPDVKDTITSQINYTKNRFEEARYAMKAVLDGGGSLEEARSAYLEKLAVTKKEIESFGANSTEKNVSKIKKDEPKINSKKIKGLSIVGKK